MDFSVYGLCIAAFSVVLFIIYVLYQRGVNKETSKLNSDFIKKFDSLNSLVSEQDSNLNQRLDAYFQNILSMMSTESKCHTEIYEEFKKEFLAAEERIYKIEGYIGWVDKDNPTKIKRPIFRAD